MRLEQRRTQTHKVRRQFRAELQRLASCRVFEAQDVSMQGLSAKSLKGRLGSGGEMHGLGAVTGAIGLVPEQGMALESPPIIGGPK